MIEPIPQRDDEIGARVRSARVGNTLYFAITPGGFNKDSVLIAFLSGRVKYSGCPPSPHRYTLATPLAASREQTSAIPASLVALGPARLTRRPAMAMTQHIGIELLARLALLGLQIISRSGQIPHRLLLLIRHPDRREIT